MERRLLSLLEVDGDLTREVHELRKLGKRLRGGLVIVQEAKPLMRWISVIGRLLGGTRDAVVRVDTWKTLGFDQPVKGSIEAVIAAMVEQSAARGAGEPPQEVVDWSLAALRQIRSRLENQSDEQLAEAGRKGSSRLLRRLRKRLRQAVEASDEKDFHEARKVVKAWLGGMGLVAPGQPLPGSPTLRKLADLLGSEHDFEVFGAWLDLQGFSTATAPRVRKRLAKLQSRSRRQSLALIRKQALPVLKRLPAKMDAWEGTKKAAPSEGSAAADQQAPAAP